MESYNVLRLLLLLSYANADSIDSKDPPVAATAAAPTPSRKRISTLHRSRARLRKENNDPFLGLMFRQQVDETLSLSLANDFTGSIPTTKDFTDSMSMTNELTESISMSLPMMTTIPITSPTPPVTSPIDAAKGPLPIESLPPQPPSSRAKTEAPTAPIGNEGLQAGLIAFTVIVIAACLATILYYRKKYHVAEDARRSSEESKSSSSDGDRNTGPDIEQQPVAANEDQPDDLVPASGSFEIKDTWQSADASVKFVPVIVEDFGEGEEKEEEQVEDSVSEIESPEKADTIEEDRDASSCEVEEAVISDIEESETKSRNGDEIELSSDIQTTEPSTISVSEQSQSSEVSVPAKKDSTAIARVKSEDTDESGIIGVISEVGEKERLVLKQLGKDLDQTLKLDDEVDDRPDKWREEFRNDIRNGIDKMCAIHQQMLEQHAVKNAPIEIQNEYYRAISRAAVQRAEMEVKKLEVESLRMELERKKLELELIKVEEEKKNMLASDGKESDGEESDGDESDGEEVAKSGFWPTTL